MKKTCVITILMILLAGVLNTVQALSEGELEQRRIELRMKIEEIGKNIENIEIELTENLEEINQLDESIYVYETQINQISETLTQIENQIAIEEEALQTVEERYQYQKELLEKRLVTIYKSGQMQYLDIMLSSQNLVDLVSKYYYIGKMIEYDESLIDKVAKEKAKIEETKEILKNSKDNLKIYKNEQKKIIISLENAKVVRNSKINKLSQEERNIKRELELYQNELDLVELEVLMAALEGQNSNYIGGTFAWPAPRVLYNNIPIWNEITSCYKSI